MRRKLYGNSCGKKTRLSVEGNYIMEKRLLGVKDLSEYIGIQKQTVYNRVNRGDFPIPHKKVFGRLKWEKQDVDHYLDRIGLRDGLKND